LSTNDYAGTLSFKAGEFFRKYLIVFILIGLIALLAVMTGGTFIKTQNLLNVVRQVSVIAILGIGLTFVIISGGIDLSVGSVLALSAVVSTSLAQLPEATNLMWPGVDVPVFIAIAAGLGVGVGAGLINGVLVAYFRLAPFIVTLGMLTAASGVALIYSGGRPVSRLDPDFNWFGQGEIFGIPAPIILLGVVAVGAHILLTRRAFGRHLFALGNNEEAVRVAGIKVKGIKVGIYVISGLLAGLGGIILAGRIGSGNPTLGAGIELDAIAATVIGGTSLAGGVGTIWGTLVGAMIIGSMNTGLDLLNVSVFVQKVVIGVIIIVALIIDERKNRGT
jgi:ribose/xylose/arabinose/galactoside ABC-type transport system permease subunit